LVPRYKEVADLLREPGLGGFRFQGAAQPRADARSPAGPAHSFLQRIFVATDGSDHLRLRTLISNALKQRVTVELHDVIARHVEELLAAAARRGFLEVVSELAYPLPLRVVGHLFSLPAHEWDTVGRHALSLSRMFTPFVAEPDRRRADLAMDWLQAYFAALLDRRVVSPGDDILSELAVAATKGLLSRSEAIDNTIFVVFAGLETSMSLIAAGCAALARHPHELARLRADASLVPAAVEEFLRYDAPTQITARAVREPIEVTGHALRKGRIVLLMLGSANHDEARFEAPERLDVGRSPNPHLSFGAGAHYCTGATLARLEVAILVERITQVFSVFQPAGEVVRDPIVTPRTYSLVPIRLKKE
jgi:cytochrome P450